VWCGKVHDRRLQSTAAGDVSRRGLVLKPLLHMAEQTAQPQWEAPGSTLTARSLVGEVGRADNAAVLDFLCQPTWLERVRRERVGHEVEHS